MSEYPRKVRIITSQKEDDAWHNFVKGSVATLVREGWAEGISATHSLEVFQYVNEDDYEEIPEEKYQIFKLGDRVVFAGNDDCLQFGYDDIHMSDFVEDGVVGIVTQYDERDGSYRAVTPASVEGYGGFYAPEELKLATEETVQAVPASKLKPYAVGSRVVMSKQGEGSWTSAENPSELNPVGVEGVVVADVRTEWTRVNWDNGQTNVYQPGDLDLVEEIAKEAAPQETPFKETSLKGERAPRVKYIYVVHDEDGLISMVTQDRAHAREVKADLGGKKEGIVITAYVPIKEIR